MRKRPWVCVNTAAAASMLAMASLSFADTSNCTAAWGGVGCDDAACQATVCGVDSFCCAVAWDSFCAGEAVSLCGAIGDSDRTQPNDSRNGSICCFAWGGVGCDSPACEAAVCAVDSYCCTIEWDAICASEANTLCPGLCWGPPPTCTGGDCCTANGGLGCDDFDCCAGVCMFDFLCCSVEWDQSCADVAHDFCPALCGVGDCCVVHDGTGCNNAECEAAVCAVDEFCCTVQWDDGCVKLTPALCPQLNCGRYQCGGPGSGECCSPHAGVGCDDVDCCTTVCDIDAFCCEVEWSSGCAALAITLCGTFCQPFPPDLNNDGAVDGADLGILLGGWGFPGSTDLDGDGTTNGVDLEILLSSWTL
ncbi:MAG: hypothetical protein U0572_03115 [Phycisphaerales bacterium]